MADVTDDGKELRTALLAEMKPKGPIEMSVFDRLARSAWVLQRLGSIELQGADPQTLRAMEKLENYRNHHIKMYEKALTFLRKLQTERAVRSRRSVEAARQEAPLADMERVQRAARRVVRQQRRPAIDLAKLPPATKLIQ
jgi:hypothetical protein